ncbi:MAG: hypothetical protein ACI9HK_000267 [Pirellulaceae bacterium]|jgi:hypothetical protein
MSWSGVLRAASNSTGSSKLLGIKETVAFFQRCGIRKSISVAKNFSALRLHIIKGDVEFVDPQPRQRTYANIRQHFGDSRHEEANNFNYGSSVNDWKHWMLSSLPRLAASRLLHYV